MELDEKPSKKHQANPPCCECLQRSQANLWWGNACNPKHIEQFPWFSKVFNLFLNFHISIWIVLFKFEKIYNSCDRRGNVERRREKKLGSWLSCDTNFAAFMLSINFYSTSPHCDCSPRSSSWVLLSTPLLLIFRRGWALVSPSNRPSCLRRKVEESGTRKSLKITYAIKSN